MEARLSRTRLSGTTPRAVIELIFRFRHRFLGTLAAVLLLVVAYALLAPRQYTSEMSVVVTGQAESAPAPNAAQDVQVNRAIEILESRKTAEQVLRQTGEFSSSRKKSSMDATPPEQSIEKFNRHLQVDQPKSSNVLHITYAASSPRLATETLQHLQEILLADPHLYKPVGLASTSATSEKERLQQDLHKAQQELATYRQNSHIVSIPDEKAAFSKQLIQLQVELQKSDTEVSELSERLTAGEKELQHLTERQLRQQKNVPNVLAVEHLTTTLNGLRNQKTALLTKYQPTDRLVQEVDQQIVNTSEALESAAKMQSFEETTDVNPIWQQLALAVSKNALDRSAAQARQKSQTAHLAELQASLRRIETTDAGLEVLEAKVNQLQDAYDLSTRKLDEAQRAGGTAQPGSSIVTVTKPPTFSAIPSSPSPVFCLLGALLAAPLLAMAVILLSELARNTIASPSELSRVSRLPVMAVNPFIHAAHLARRSKVPSTNMPSAEKQTLKTRFKRLFSGLRLLPRFPLPATAAAFMGRSMGGSATRGPTVGSSPPLKLPHSFSP